MPFVFTPLGGAARNLAAADGADCGRSYTPHGALAAAAGATCSN
jgi:hypothetical protein